MKADKGGFADFGDYLFQAPDIFIATGKHGAVAWLRPDFAKATMRRCARGKEGASKPAGVKPSTNSADKASVDPRVVGTWELPLKTGSTWVWKIAPNGTYDFHSKGTDATPSHSGTFSARDGKWSLTATTGIPGYTDTGNYLYQAPNVPMATGHLGGAAWLRPASSSCRQ